MDASDQNFLQWQLHRLTVDEYYRMAEVGLLARDARVELIEGVIYDMASISSRHAGTVNQLARLLSSVGDKAIVSVQNPLRLDERSEPQPDLMLLAPRADFYGERHPGAAEVLLLIEVAHSSARYDRVIKLPLYARHGVPEVWIVDLDNGVVHFHSAPVNGVYAEQASTRTPGIVGVRALPGVHIDLSRVLG
jgi:Uma2 family endonuclease